MWNSVSSLPDNMCKCLAPHISYQELLCFHRMVCCCKSRACSTHFGCSFKSRGISWILESELHFFVFIVAHFCIHVEYIFIIHKILGQQPLKMIYFARKRNTFYCLLWRKCTWESIINSLWIMKERCTTRCCLIICFGILCRFLRNQRLRWLSQPSEQQWILLTIKWVFITALSWKQIAILRVFQHEPKPH